MRLEFSNPLAHRIEAGADIFLMPSRYRALRFEPALQPEVRHRAGRAGHRRAGRHDHRCHARKRWPPARPPVSAFREYSGLALAKRCSGPATCSARKPEWQRLITTGMRQDWSWTQSARQYVRLYGETLAQVRPKTMSKV